MNGNVGDAFTTDQKIIPGYTFKEVQGNTTGTFTEAEQTVTYVYTKDPVAGANVIAKYVDDKGNSINDNAVLNGNVGDAFTTDQKIIPGYTFKEVQGNTTGTYTDTEQVVTYVYTKNTEIDTTQTPTNKENNNTTSFQEHPSQIYTDVKGINKKVLPKTGDSKTIFGFIGVILIVFVSLFNIFIKRNKQI